MMYSVSSLCVGQSAYILRVEGASTQKRNSNPLRLSHSFHLCHFFFFFISIASLSDLSLFLLLPPSYSIAPPGCPLGSPSMTADTQYTHTCKHIVTTMMQCVSRAYAWLAIKWLLWVGTSFCCSLKPGQQMIAVWMHVCTWVCLHRQCLPCDPPVLDFYFINDRWKLILACSWKSTLSWDKYNNSKMKHRINCIELTDTSLLCFLLSHSL